MLFDVYGANAGFQWLGLFMVLGALILLNEFARRTKAGGIFMFIGVCAAMTVYCVVVEIGAAMGAEWALNNPTIKRWVVGSTTLRSMRQPQAVSAS